MDVEQDGLYRVKAAHMHRLAEQARNNAARAAYLSLEAGWLTLAQRTSELRDRLWGAKVPPYDSEFSGDHEAEDEARARRGDA
jgi:hypothetical protein